MSKIGFIGLGHMGKPMVMNLLKYQHQVKVFDIVPQAVNSLVEQGAVAARSTVDAADGVDMLITMLQTGEQVKSICLGEEGVFARLNSDALFIDSSSIAINDTMDVHSKADEMNLAMVDAPVSGGVKGAEAAALTIMVGGREQDYLRAKPILACLGNRVIHAGSAGKGQAAKICNNMLLGISMIAVSEAFNLGEKLGINPKKLFEICSHASGQCWSMTSYCPVPNVIDNVPSNNNYEPGFTAAMMLKDLKLSQNAAQFIDAPTQLGALAAEIYQTFVDQGHEGMDFSGIYTMLQELDA